MEVPPPEVPDASAQPSQEALAALYGVVHDLRVPIRVTQTCRLIAIEALDASDVEEVRSLLERQGEAIGRVVRRIDEEMAFVRALGQGVDRDELDLGRIARTTWDEIVLSSPEKRLALLSEEGLTTNGDRRLLGIVLFRLLEEAAKRSPEGGEVRVGRTEAGAFFVRDEGWFDTSWFAFPRMDVPLVDLSSVRRAVEMHSGKVWAESEPSGGTTFWFTLA